MKTQRRVRGFSLLLALADFVGMLMACGPTIGPQIPVQAGTPTNPSTLGEPNAEPADADQLAPASPTPLPPDSIPIHMLGRSVTYNWFTHWGWMGDDDVPVVHGLYVLYHHSIDSPDNMVNSASDIIGNLPDDPRLVVWWKFCFDDFSGAEDAQPALQRNEQIVQQMYRLVVEQHKHRLMIGNALPKVSQDVDPELIKAQRQYNQWLLDFQKGHAGKVFVMDLYSVLADSNGRLRANFASAQDDSHPNEAGYQALDARFFLFLDQQIK